MENEDWLAFQGQEDGQLVGTVVPLTSGPRKQGPMSPMRLSTHPPWDRKERGQVLPAVTSELKKVRREGSGWDSHEPPVATERGEWVRVAQMERCTQCTSKPSYKRVIKSVINHVYVKDENMGYFGLNKM